MIHVRPDGGPTIQWLQSAPRFFASETASGPPGAETRPQSGGGAELPPLRPCGRMRNAFWQ